MFPCSWGVSLKNTLAPFLSLMASSRTSKNHLKRHIFWQAFRDSSRSPESLAPHLWASCRAGWEGQALAPGRVPQSPGLLLVPPPVPASCRRPARNPARLSALLSSPSCCPPTWVRRADKGGFPARFCLPWQPWLLSTVSLRVSAAVLLRLQ